MKQRSTTPVSKGRATKLKLVACAVMIAVAGPIATMPRVNADQYDDQINAIQNEINQYQASAGELSKKADSLQSELNKLTTEKAIIQGQVDLSQAKYEKLQNQIKETTQKIADNKDALGVTIANMYVDDTISPLEMLASSSNIGDYVDKQTYRSSVSDQLQKTIDQINELKKQLEQQKKDTERALADQKSARDSLTAKEAERQSVLSETKGQEAAYQQLSSNREGQKLQLQQQQQAAIEAAMRQAGGGGGAIVAGDPNHGGYPWEANCSLDSNAYSYGGVFYAGAGGYNGLDGMGSQPNGAGAYGCRQCVSYAAWKVYQKTGQRWSGMGNANQWPGSVPAGTGSQARANSLGVISAGEFGHIVYIESVNGDGTVNISQYNYFNAGGSGWGNYSEMRGVPASTYDTYIYL